MELFLTDRKPSPSNILGPTIAPNTFSDTSDVSGVAGSSSSTLVFTRRPLPQLDRKDYPNVTKWDASNYRGFRKNGKKDEDSLEGNHKAKGSILSSYMEDENGNPIPNGKRDAVRAMARDFFIILLQHNRAPTCWDNAGLDVQNELTYQLESAFPFFRLCEDHWKSRQVATNSYSQWRGGKIRNAPKAPKIKKEKIVQPKVIDVDAGDGENNDKSPKRPQVDEDDMRPSKRPRVEENRSPPPSDPCSARVTTQRQRVCEEFYYDYMRH